MGDSIVSVKGAGAVLSARNGTAAKRNASRRGGRSDGYGRYFFLGAQPFGPPAMIAANMAKTKMALSLNCSAHEYGWWQRQAAFHRS